MHTKKILLLAEHIKPYEIFNLTKELQESEITWFLLSEDTNIEIPSDSSIIKPARNLDISEYDIVVCYNTSLKIISSISNIMPNDKFSETLNKCIINSTTAILTIDSVNDMIKVGSGLPPAYREKISSYIKNLSSYGFIIVNRSDLKNEIERFYLKKINNYFSKEVITKDDIIDAFQKGQRNIILKKGAIITPLARDEAKRYEIEVIIL